jgi:GT2 family glycosyltransferase
MISAESDNFISVIILNYNTFEMTCDCIQSILDKTTHSDFEIILVDNASTNCNPDDFLVKFQTIKLIKSEVNLGFSKGNNLGIDKAKGDTILLLNSDTVLLNDSITHCSQRLNQADEIGIITSKLMFPSGEIQRQCRPFDTIALNLIERFRIHKFWSKEKRAKVLIGGYFDHQTEMLCDRIWGTFFMFKRDILSSFPGKKLADQFFMYGEDNEWCYQLRRYTNKKILYFPSAEVTHIMGGSRFSSDMSQEKLKIINQNKKKYMSEYYGSFKTKVLFFLQGIKL